MAFVISLMFLMLIYFAIVNFLWRKETLNYQRLLYLLHYVYCYALFVNKAYVNLYLKHLIL